MPNNRPKHTGQSAVVGDEAGHVYVLVVDTQVLHAAHELSVTNRKVLWEFWDPSKEKWPSQVQRSENVNICTHIVFIKCNVEKMVGAE